MVNATAAESAMIDLSANENPLGPSPQAMAAIAQAIKGLHRYPEKDGDPLRDALATQLQLQRNQILLGNGATELLEFAARACLSPLTGSSNKAAALIATPCFVPYHKVINRAGGHLIKVPCALGDNPLPALLRAVTDHTRLIILGSPNNPTGDILSHQPLLDFIRALPPQVLLVLDEAYIEYVDDADCADSLALLAQGYNLLVLRSLSKAYGLAGLRIGYGIAAPSLIERLNHQRQHYNTNSLAQAAALAALDDHAHLTQTLLNNRLERDYLCRAFTAMGLNHLPSHANFILLQVGDGEAFVEGLLQQGIRVKPMARYQLPQHIRISVGLPSQNRALVQAVQQQLKRQFGLPFSQPSTDNPTLHAKLQRLSA